MSPELFAVVGTLSYVAGAVLAFGGTCWLCKVVREFRGVR